MSTAELQIADDFALPQRAVTSVTAILAKRGAGKTYAAAVYIEEMVAAGAPVVIMDPIGAWWGLRSSADGQSEGLPFTILGGDHGDLPLEPTAGRVIADLVAAQPVLLILDMTGFESDAAQQRFVTDFSDQLYRRNRRPLHLVLEEADEFAPQQPMRDQTVMVNRVQRLARRGRQRGIGLTLICQRSAALHKGVLTQADILVAGRTTAALDQRAIETWISNKQVEEQRAIVMESLHDLPTDTKWVWAPELGILQRVKVRARRTFDSSATPELGAQLEAPRVLAAVDLEALRGQMASLVAQAEADDPRVLRKRIATLERQIKTAGPVDPPGVARLSAENADLRQQLAAERAKQPEQVEVPVLQPGDTAAVEQIITALRAEAGSLELALSRAGRPTAIRSAPDPAPVARKAPAVPASRPAAEPSTDGGLVLGKAHRAILTVLAQFPDGRTITQIAMLTGYSSKGGGFRNALGALRSAGFIERGEPVRATADGLAALGDAWEPLPEGPALLDHWVSQLSKAEGLALQVIVAAWPGSISREEVAQQTGYAPDGGGFRNALGHLRTLLLISGSAELLADETLAQQAQGALRLLPGSG